MPYRAFHDRTGERYGRLVITGYAGISGGSRVWYSKCDCGTNCSVSWKQLQQNHKTSCGCRLIESRQTYGGQAGRNKMPHGQASRNELLASYKKSARDRGIEWRITDNQFFEMVAADCVYCGSPAESLRKPNAQVNGGFTYSGIDRIDNAFGYVPENIAPCCWICNRAKGTLSVTEFTAWLDRIVIARGARFEHGESGRR